MAEKAVDSPLASVFDNPEAYIAGDRRRALAAGVELPDRVTGAALFAGDAGDDPRRRHRSSTAP